MNVQSEELLLQVAADTLNTPRQSLTWESSRNVVQGWDSLGHMTVVLEVEREVGVRVPVTRIAELTDIDSIVRIVSAESN